MSDRRSFVVDHEEEGTRLDVFLQSLCPDLSRSRIQNLVAEGAVSVGDRQRKVSYRVRVNDPVVIDVPDATPLAVEAEEIPLNVVFEDGDLLVVDKPAGMTVHPAPGSPSGTLVNALLHHCRDLSGINGVLRPGIVHRLDKDTTGLLVVAKNDATHRHLAAQLQAHSMERLYSAVLWGSLTEPGRIDAPVDRNRNDRLKMAVVDRGGRHAVTHYEPEEELASFLTRVRFQLETGRTHQIRVHAQHLNHPVFGDPTYGGRSRTDGIADSLRPLARKLLGLIDRQALHAQTLGFRHPRTDQWHRFSQDLPADMAALLEAARA